MFCSVSTPPYLPTNQPTNLPPSLSLSLLFICCICVDLEMIGLRKSDNDGNELNRNCKCELTSSSYFFSVVAKRITVKLILYFNFFFAKIFHDFKPL